MTWDPAIREVILQRVQGDESLNAICKDPGMPSMDSVHRWIKEDPEFAVKYARAKEIQAETIVNGFRELEEQVLTGDVPPDAAKVVFWSRQWRAAKLRPKVYGDKVQHEHSGGLNVSLKSEDKTL